MVRRLSSAGRHRRGAILFAATVTAAGCWEDVEVQVWRETLDVKRGSDPTSEAVPDGPMFGETLRATRRALPESPWLRMSDDTRGPRYFHAADVVVLPIESRDAWVAVEELPFSWRAPEAPEEARPRFGERVSVAPGPDDGSTLIIADGRIRERVPSSALLSQPPGADVTARVADAALTERRHGDAAAVARRGLAKFPNDPGLQAVLDRADRVRVWPAGFYDGEPHHEDYPPSSALDDDPATTWVANSGSLLIGFPLTKLTELELSPGYTKSPSLWTANGRVRKLRYRTWPPTADVGSFPWPGDPPSTPSTVSDWREVTIDAPPSIDDGKDAFVRVPIQAEGEAIAIEIEVVEMAKGSRYADVCVSDVRLFRARRDDENRIGPPGSPCSFRGVLLGPHIELGLPQLSIELESVDTAGCPTRDGLHEAFNAGVGDGEVHLEEYSCTEQGGEIRVTATQRYCSAMVGEGCSDEEHDLRYRPKRIGPSIVVIEGAQYYCSP